MGDRLGSAGVVGLFCFNRHVLVVLICSNLAIILLRIDAITRNLFLFYRDSHIGCIRYTFNFILSCFIDKLIKAVALN